MVLVFKTRPPRSDDFEKLSRWLVKEGALKYDHQRGSLHDHLVRVFAMLEGRGRSLSVSFAGGLHSIYGTNVFTKQMLSPEPHVRARVAGAFGAEAEDYAYTFSQLNRPETLDVAASFLNDPRLRTNDWSIALQRRYSEPRSVGWVEAGDLCLIECANLADQNSLDKWPNLKNLWEGK